MRRVEKFHWTKPDPLDFPIRFAFVEREEKFPSLPHPLLNKEGEGGLEKDGSGRDEREAQGDN